MIVAERITKLHVATDFAIAFAASRAASGDWRLNRSPLRRPLAYKYRISTDCLRWTKIKKGWRTTADQGTDQVWEQKLLEWMLPIDLCT
jgi:hypothetical protein